MREHVKLIPSARLKMICNDLDQFIPSNIPFLIQGETGIGNEFVTRYIGELPDLSFNLQTLNYTNISYSLVETELYSANCLGNKCHSSHDLITILLVQVD